MSSRKESLKKSLGISEYPWSSDDDELTSASTFIDVHILRRQPTEQQTSVADTPGTSGQPVSSSQNASPSRVSRLERDLYWSLADSRPTHTQPTMAYKTRPSLIQKPGEVREIRSDRPKLPTDIRRILAFKKFTRQLGNLAASKPNSNLYAMSSRGYAGTSRNPLFTPTLMTGHPALKRLQCSRNALRMNNLRSTNSSTNPNYTSTAETTATNGAEAAGSQILESGRGNTWIFEPVVVDEPPRADSADDVIEVPETTEPVNQVDENITTEAEPAIDVDTHDTSGGGVSLEEEIVEIDPPDYQDVPPSAVDVEDTTDNGVVNTDVGLNEAATGPVNEEAEALQEQSEANKRRDADDKEPNTVKEYNQSLLRLLECPVCLEWMEPPMSQCRRGHLVCGRCRARLAACPVCRTTFSSVRNRAMEGVAEMVRYPCRHGCGREVRLRRRIGHESSCGARRYYCPVPVCSDRQPLPRPHLLHHFQSKHMPILKIGQKHRFSMKVNSEQHDTWLITALQEYFYLRVDIDIRTWGVILYVAYIGPKCNANNFIYEVSVEGQHNSRRMVYSRNTHSDLESSTLNVSRQDCFHLTLDQALNFLRFKNRHCEPDKFLDFDLEITKCENTESNVDSDS